MLSKMIPKQSIEIRKERLKKLIKTKAFLRRSPPEEQFELASGGKSWEFFDCKRVTQNPEGITLIAEIIFEMIKDRDVEGIGGIATGSIPICTAVAHLSFLKEQPISAFWVRDIQKEHGTKNLVEGGLKPNSSVIIVDDVTTKGNSMEKAVKAVLKMNCQIVELITMVDREEGARQKFENKGFKFTSLFKMSDFKS